MIFQYFFVWEIGKKNGDFSILPLSKDFWRLCLYLYIIYLRFFSKLWFTVSPSRIEKSPFRNGDFSIQTFSGAFRTFCFEICLSFFPVHFLHSEWRNLHSEWKFLHFKLFHTRVMNLFFWNVSFFFLPDHFLNSELLNWDFSMLNGNFLHSNYWFYFLHSE